MRLEKNSSQYRVHLVDEAIVVDRGEQVRVWFMPYNDGWIRAKDHPLANLETASTEQRDPSCPPGTIWRRSIDFSLSPRTPLLSRVTRPYFERLGTIDYLVQNKRTMRRHIEETWFEVAGNYRLRKTKEPRTFSQARQTHQQSTRQR